MNVPTNWYYDIWWGWLNILKVLKMSSLQCLYNISKNNLKMEAVFLHAVNIKISYNTLGAKVSYKLILSLLMGMIKHPQSTQINKFAISLQFLKEQVREGVFFLYLDKHQSFCKLALFWWEWPDISKMHFKIRFETLYRDTNWMHI